TRSVRGAAGSSGPIGWVQPYPHPASPGRDGGTRLARAPQYPGSPVGIPPGPPWQVHLTHWNPAWAALAGTPHTFESGSRVRTTFCAGSNPQTGFQYANRIR